MSVQKRLAQFGAAKQVDKTTAATAPTYVVGLTDGTVYGAEIDESDLDTTWNDRVLQGHDRMATVPGTAAGMVVTPKMIGLLLFAACGTKAVVGSSAPYTHTITPGTSLPWLTIFGSYGADKVAMAGSKIDSLELSWEKTGALKVSIKTMGRTFEFDSTWTGGTAERVPTNLFKGVGGSFTVGGASARVTGGSIKIENGLEAIIASYSETPDEVVEAEIKCDISLTIVPDDMSLFRTVVTGADDGTDASGFPVYGEITCEWINGDDVDLTFNTTSAKFATKMPDVDPSGGAAELALEASTAASAFSFVLRNAVASY